MMNIALVIDLMGALVVYIFLCTEIFTKIMENQEIELSRSSQMLFSLGFIVFTLCFSVFELGKIAFFSYLGNFKLFIFNNIIILFELNDLKILN